MIAIMVVTWVVASPVLAEERIRVSDAWARASILASRPGAAYVTIESTSDDTLIGASTPVAEQIMIHAVEKDGDVSRMKHIETLELPAGERTMLSPGGMHLMLTGLQDKLKEGATFPMTLSFEKAGKVTIEVAVLGIAAKGPQEIAE